MVEVERQLAPDGCDAVVLDNQQAAIDAMSHVLALGHERIGLLTVDTAWTSDAGRQQGYRMALERAGIGVDEALVMKVAPTEAESLVERQIRNLLGRNGLTAIFAANNMLTVLAWRVMRQAGLRLPDDISLVGFDDVSEGERERSFAAVECLHGGLIVRGSTGAPRKRR